ncbi:MAG TPA: Na+/H+ antiporter NhaA [Acidimicrobiia bacterium]|nr:Na+/H+ antiporter NhaA [Acidimicrobiia bacterium]
MSRSSTPRSRRFVDALNEFLQTEAAGGAVLLVATVAALALANSPADGWYRDIVHHEIDVSFGWFDLREDVQHWINDGLMTLFFFVVGLEIKRELAVGELRTVRRAAVPAFAALGGMVVPAALFLAITAGGPGARGWGIPMATDIAFALGVLALFGSRIPSGLRLFLLSLAIVDDIGAILVIAVFYSERISLGWLLAAGLAVVVIVSLQRIGVGAISVYVPLGLAVWLFTFESGVHATIAGVALGLLTPVAPIRGRNVAETLEHRLHPWTSFLVVPLFALANAGVALSGEAASGAIGSALAWGIVVGLVVGKPLGIMSAVLVARRLRWGELPDGVTLPMLAGASCVAGIGFTVSLFVADLAFRAPNLDDAKLGVLAASIAAGGFGAVVLRRATVSRRSDGQM